MNKYKSLGLLFGILILIFGGFFAYRSVVYKAQVSGFSLTATDSDSAGVKPSSHFILKTTASLTEQVIQKYIKIAPYVSLSVQKVSAAENTFEIIPETELHADTIYTIQIDEGPLATREYSWAYQVKAPFQVISSIPGERATDVPTNTGIEIYFNRDGIVNPEKFIEISPAISGRFEVSGNKVTFVPDNNFTDRAIYKLRIKAGLESVDTEDVFPEDKIIEFQVGTSYSRDNKGVYFSRSFVEFKPDSSLVFGVNAYNTSSVEATVYKFDDAQRFIDSVASVKGEATWARYYSGFEGKLPEDKKVLSGNLPVESINEFSNIIRLPQSLDIGYYAMVIKSGETQDILWFQVNPMVSFAAFAGSKSIVWLKDIALEKNIEGARIFFDNKEVGRTDSSGVALFDTPTEIIRKPTDPYYTKNQEFLIARTSSGDLVIPIEDEYGSPTFINQNDLWWDYISLNKNVYLPTDTLRFWAIEKSRAGDFAGEDIEVRLTNPYWEAEQDNVTTYAETKLKISEYNTVTGELSFSNLKPGVYDLTLSKEGETIMKQLVTVSAYIKPAYKIVATPDRNSLFAGDRVTFKIQAEFFDGTPVANTAISYSTYGPFGKNSNGTLTLDSEGKGSIKIIPEYTTGELYYHWPSYMSVTIKPLKSEEGQIETNSFVFVFGPHIYNSISQKQSAADITFAVKTRMVVLKDNSSGEPYWNTESYLGDNIVGANTTVDIKEVVYIKEQTGTRYDPINKLTYPVYIYKTEERPISSKSIISDESGLAKITFVPEQKKTYKFVFTTYDNIGRADTKTRYVYGGFGDVDYSSGNPYYYLYNVDDKIDYKIGDPINLQIQTNEGAMPQNAQGNYLFMTVNNGKVKYLVQDTPKYNAVFKSDDVPNVGIWSGWFYGGQFHNAQLQNISYDANERRLSVSVTKDKNVYKPGDDVSLDIKVTDKDNNPVKAEVNLSALDEAVFSIRPSEKDIVNDLYRDMYSQVVVRVSNKPPYGGGGAEKGGGEGDGPRSNIQEMAIWKSITTDALGNASIQFKLPDNITSWRLTSQAVTKDLFVGKSVNFIPVTLPFFVDATLNNTYLSGDELVLRLRSFGTAPLKGDTEYTVEGTSLSSNKITQSGSGSTDISLGSLKLGNNELTVTAQNGEFRDSLIRSLEVIDSHFAKETSDFYEGISGLKIKNNTTRYTTLVFSPYGRGRLYNDLKSLSYGWGMRLDQKGAQIVATHLLEKYFGEKIKDSEFKISKYQGNNGGLQLLPYSSDEVELSAISAHLFDDLSFNKNALKNYLFQSLTDKKSDTSRIVRALYGLTAFNAPVLSKIQTIKDDKSLTLKDKVFVALALDSIGAKEEARIYYNRAIYPSVERKSSYAYLGGLVGDDTITATALLAALMVSLEEPESDKFALFVKQNHPRETLSSFEYLLYIKSLLPKLDAEDVSFAYKKGSEVGSKVLENGESFALTLSPKELESFEISEVKGKLGIIASYEKPSSPESILKDDNLTLARSYEVNGVIKDSFNEGDLVMVRLTPTLGINSLSGAYQITDYLPSGLRPVGQESSTFYKSTYDYDMRVYPVEINDQKITFVIYKDSNYSIYYYARVVSKGKYKAEPALMQSLRNLESATISNEDTITIN